MADGSGVRSDGLCQLALEYEIGIACRVHTEATPISPENLIAVLELTHTDLFQQPPSKERLTMANAHIAIENGRGKKIYGNNFGNIGAARVPTGGHPFYRIGGSRFLAHPSAEAGAKAYWMHMVRRCGTALVRFSDGSGYQSAADLKRCGYHRADVNLYGAALQSLYNEWIAK